MKKVLLFATVALGLNLSAQSIPLRNSLSPEISKNKIDKIDIRSFNNQSAGKGGSVSTYYSYTDTVSAFSTDLDFYNLSLSPDSLTTQVFSDGSLNSHYFHAAGAIYDMKFSGWGLDGFSAGDQVTLDSLFIVGFYDILNSGQTDTLRFHVFQSPSNSPNFSGVTWNTNVFSYFPTANVPQTTLSYQFSPNQGYVGGITANNVITLIKF
jgi:hypothetical protein